MIEINQKTLHDLILHDVRYTLGRQTWTPAECCVRVRKFWPHVSPERRVIVARDVSEYLDRMTRTGEGVKECWVDLAAWMEAHQ